MLDVLADNQQEIEHELRERIQTLFTSNNLTTDCVSITMQLFRPTQEDGLSTIKILIKDRDSGETLHENLVIT